MSTGETAVRNDAKDLDVKNYFSWMSYDVANTFYAGGILQLMVLTWVLVRGQQDGYSYAVSNGLFQITLSIASIIMALMLPVLGSISDVLNERKKFVLFFSAVSILTTFFFSISKNYILVLVFFAISLIAYQWALVFYDAMLPGVVPPGREARLSSIAIAVGYLGGAVPVIYAAFLASNEPNSNPSEGMLTLGYFPDLINIIIAGFFFFALPMVFVRETDWQNISKNTLGDTIDIEENPTLKEIVKSSFAELLDTFRGIRDNNRGMFFYIIAYFIIADFTNLVVLINTEYLRVGLGLPEQLVITVSLIFGGSLIVFSYGVGKIADNYGAKRAFQSIGVLWMIALSLMILLDLEINLLGMTIIIPIEFIFVIAVITGPAFSGLWIAQRQMVLELVPTEQELGRYFGLTKFSGKISSAIGPLMWAFLLLFARESLILSLTNSYRFAIFCMAIFLFSGFAILQFGVPNNHAEFKERKQIMLESLEAQNI